MLHITGRRDFAEVQERLGDARPGYRVVEYLDSLADPLAASDLVVARAGGSIFEIAAAGRPAILIPYPAATADHQTGNARWMANAGAAEVLPDAELTAEALRSEVKRLLGDPRAAGADVRILEITRQTGRRRPNRRRSDGRR